MWGKGYNRNRIGGYNKMRPFKFLTNPIAYTYNNEQIWAGEIFYTMNKEEIISISGEVLPKYIIIKRYVSKTHQDRFKPDYDKLFYFKSRYDAEMLKEGLIRWDEELENT
jgi:hypothetical protein